mmetsp:Transcript_3412/g.2385  ORF Transcript_3412/g.2385 Transcript_3412/m.2385 type:complete len:403 (-) Transcript_3412:294-1502(-)
MFQHQEIFHRRRRAMRLHHRPVEVGEDAGGAHSSLADGLVCFEEETDGLLGHDSVVAFEGAGGGVVLGERGQPRPEQEARSPARPPQRVQPRISNPRVVRLEPRCQMMDIVEESKVSVLDILLQFVVSLAHVQCCLRKRICICQQRRNHVHMRLVVEQLALHLLLRQIRKLPPHHRIPSCDGEALREVLVGLVDHAQTNANHYGVQDSQVPLHAERSLPVHLHESHEQHSARDADVVECNVSIFLAVISKLRSNVSSLSSWQHLVSFYISHWDQERLHPKLLSLDDELRKHHRMRGMVPQLPRPELGGGDGGAVDDEFVGVGVEGGGSLQALHERPVAQLCLRVAPVDLHLLHQRQPLSTLLLIRKVRHRQVKHGDVEGICRDALERIEQTPSTALQQQRRN